MTITYKTSKTTIEQRLQQPINQVSGRMYLLSPAKKWTMQFFRLRNGMLFSYEKEESPFDKPRSVTGIVGISVRIWTERETSALQGRSSTDINQDVHPFEITHVSWEFPLVFGPPSKRKRDKWMAALQKEEELLVRWYIRQSLRTNTEASRKADGDSLPPESPLPGAVEDVPKKEANGSEAQSAKSAIRAEEKQLLKEWKQKFSGNRLLNFSFKKRKEK